MIYAEKISKIYKSRDGIVKAVDEMSLDFEDAGMYILVGKSGSGKTTLLNLLAGLDKVDSGQIKYKLHDKEINLSELTEEQLDSYHNLHVGFVFQEYNLIYDWTVEDNIQIVLRQNTMYEVDDYDEKITEVLEYVGIGQLKNRRVNELSGGQAQRVAIARAIIKNPNIIFADEPTGNLDSRSAQQILELLKKISKQCLVILVTHDEHAALSYADKIIEIKDGKIFSQKDMKESKLHKLTLTDTSYDYKKEFVSRSIRELSAHFFEFLSGNLSKKYVVEYSFEMDSVSGSCKTLEDRTPAVRKINEMSLLRYAIKALGCKKGRSILSILIVSIVICFSQLLMSVAVADIGRPMALYLQDNKIQQIYLQEALSYENSFYEKEDVTRGDSLGIKAYVESFEQQNVYKACTTMPISSSESDTLAIVYTNELHTELRYGNYPKQIDEVCITDFVAYLLGMRENCIGEEISLHETKFRICGVIKTDYKTSGFLNRFNKGITTEKDGYNLKYHYSAVVCRDEFEKYLQSNIDYMDIKASNFVIDTERYMKSFCRYASLEGKEGALVVGRWPDKENEVVVSYSFAEYHNLLNKEGDIIRNDFAYQDIYDKKYKDAYVGDINLYDFMQQVRVVGVIEDSEKEIDVWINDKIYSDIEKQYYEESIFNLFYLDVVEIKHRDMRNMINEIYAKGIYIDEPGAIDISNVYNMKQELLVVLIVLIIIFCVLILWLSRVFVYHEVKSENRKAGILRALGVNRKNMIKVFSYEMIISCVAAFCVSIGLTICGMNWVNEMLSKEKETLITYFFQSEWIVVSVLLCFVGVCILNVMEAIGQFYDRTIIALLK